MKILTNEQQKSYENNLKRNILKIESIGKLGTIVIIQVNIKVLHMTYVN